MDKRIQGYIIDENTSVIDAMKTINKGDNAIVFICKDNILLAALSDGDVRRFIIEGGNITNSVKSIACYQPIYVYEDDEVNYDEIMREKGITALPIVDKHQRIVDIAFLKKPVWEKRAIKIPVVIMAGGKGKRLRPYTEILPKPLIPIGEKTITEHIMERFREYECSHFDMIVNYKKNFIKSYFLDHEVQYDVEFTEEQDFLGTAGGLGLLVGKYQGTMFVTNCDVLIDADYRAIYDYHIVNRNIITIVCAHKKVTIPYGTIETDDDGKVIDIHEKPTYELDTNTGVYLIEQSFLSFIPNNVYIDITDVIEKCIKEGQNVGMYLINENAWLDMGQLEEMERMKKHLCVE